MRSPILGLEVQCRDEVHGLLLRLYRRIENSSLPVKDIQPLLVSAVEKKSESAAPANSKKYFLNHMKYKLKDDASIDRVSVTLYRTGLIKKDAKERSLFWRRKRRRFGIIRKNAFPTLVEQDSTGIMPILERRLTTLKN